MQSIFQANFTLGNNYEIPNSGKNTTMPRYQNFTTGSQTVSSFPKGGSSSASFHPPRSTVIRMMSGNSSYNNPSEPSKFDNNEGDGKKNGNWFNENVNKGHQPKYEPIKGEKKDGYNFYKNINKGPNLPVDLPNGKFF